VKFDLVESFYDNYSDGLPLFYRTPSDYLAKNYMFNAGLHNMVPDNKKTSDDIPAKEIKNTSKTGFGFSLDDFTFDNGQNNFDSSAETEKDDVSSPNEPWSDSENTSDEVITEISENNPAEDKLLQAEPVILEDSSDEQIIAEDDQSLNNEEPILPEDNETAVSNEVILPENYKYIIIAGSFMNIKNARQLVDELNNKGFRSQVVGQNKYGDYRVCYDAFATLSEAQQKLAYIRKNYNPSAWIFIDN
jgi:cell division septation protein DedD